MSSKLFGTDGIRGTANQAPITADLVLTVAQAAARQFQRGNHRHRVVIGKDTRLSGYMLEPALTAGFISMGMDVLLSGPLPTPAIAQLTRSMRADLGVMISASHNPYHDNGIKLFGPDGYKLSDTMEAEIAADVEKILNSSIPESWLAPSKQLGRAHRMEDAPGRYIEFIKNGFPKGLSLAGLKIVIDCAHGAAYKVAPTVLWELGAEVIPVAVHPDGFNINHECGAVHPGTMQSQVVAHGADLGIALDGDADRVIISDENGQVIDGDQLLAVIARSWSEKGRLRGGGIVATVMSNLGLERFLEGHRLTLIRTQVGDRHVLEAMRAQGFNAGGEPSGHVILSDYTTTGDGLMAALQVLAVQIQSEKPMSVIGRQFTPLPQILRNVRLPHHLLERPEIQAAIREGEARLQGKGRLLIRRSGTEPVIRIMAEGDDEQLIMTIVKEIEDALLQCPV